MSNFKFALAIFLTILMVPSVDASIVLNRTRVIYKSDRDETSLRLTNKGDAPFLVQAWIDNGNTNVDPSKINVPFIMSPSMSKINPGEGQHLRIFYTGNTLPENKESIFWLNVLSVPPKKDSEDNKLQLAFKTRIKLFFRPSSLEGSVSSAAKKLKVENTENGLKITNPTPFYITILSFSEAEDNNAERIKVEDVMLAPFDTSIVPDIHNKIIIRYVTFINDYGATEKQKIEGF